MLTVMLMLNVGCVSKPEMPSNHFCASTEVIRLLEREIDMLSMETLRLIDHFNQEWEALCQR